jgi:SAM-dependent methyltransferase
VAATAHTGQTAFDGTQSAYERARPTYAIEAILTSLLLAGCAGIGDVVDLAAGTGKLTRVLQPHAHSIVAIEPSASMRTAFQQATAGVEVLDGRAEAIPLDDASVDLVTVGAAFHWFRPVPALAEIARVLRPGGALVVANNEWRIDAAPWLAEVYRSARSRRRVRAPGRNWRRVLEAAACFDAPCEAAKPHDQTLSHEAFIDLSRSLSSVNILAPAERAAHLAGLRELIDGLPPGALVVPFRTRAVAARRHA